MIIFESLRSKDTIFDVNITDDQLDDEISMSEIKKAIFPQNNKKSRHEDTIIAEIYKFSFDGISPFK